MNTLGALVETPDANVFQNAAPSNVAHGVLQSEVEAGSIEELQAELRAIRKKMDAIADRVRAGLGKDDLAGAKFEHAVLESEERQVRNDLKMFHRAALNGMGAVRTVRIIREDFTGVTGERGIRVEGVLA
jgi:capsule polysaccharide export protein KpsE/RkpR